MPLSILLDLVLQVLDDLIVLRLRLIIVYRHNLDLLFKQLDLFLELRILLRDFLRLAGFGCGRSL